MTGGIGKIGPEMEMGHFGLKLGSAKTTECQPGFIWGEAKLGGEFGPFRVELPERTQPQAEVPAVSFSQRQQLGKFGQ